MSDRKLFAHQGKTTRYELCNLATDPNEQADLAAENADRVGELKKLLETEQQLDR